MDENLQEEDAEATQSALKETMRETTRETRTVMCNDSKNNDYNK